MPTAAYAVVTDVDAGMARRSRGYPTVIKADGLAAGKGVIIAADEARGARPRWRQLLVERRFGTERVVVEEHPRRRGAVAAGAVRRRAGAAARLGPGLQADLRRRPRAQHRRDGLLFAGAGSRRRTRARDLCRGPPAGARRAQRAAGSPFHGVLYAGLMMTAAGRQGARVQRPLRRSRDAGDPAAAAIDLLELLHAACEPGGLARAATRVVAGRRAVTVVLASAGYPESSSSGDVITGLDAVPADVFVTHAGTAPRRLPARSSPPADGC